MPLLIKFARHLAIAAFVATVVAACSSDDPADADTGAVAAEPAMMDTGMAAMPGMNDAPAKDADQEFLRMMVDHHEGLLVMADSALKKGTSAQLKADAQKLKTDQTAERQKMLGMLKSDYSDDHMAMVMPSSNTMIAAGAQKTGAEYDRQFRENIIAHHREALTMIDRFLPRFTKPANRQMAEKMKAAQAREIADFEKKIQRGV